MAELRVLVAVDGEGGVSAAGLRLGLTQSAVSHALRAAEKKMGTCSSNANGWCRRPRPPDMPRSGTPDASCGRSRS